MGFLLAFVITGLAAGGGWLVWGIGRAFAARRRRRHELRLARTRAESDLRQAELESQVRQQELANEIYQDFVRRWPSSPPGGASGVSAPEPRFRSE